MAAGFAPLLTLPGWDWRNVLLATHGGNWHLGDGRIESGLLARRSSWGEPAWPCL